MADPAIVDVPNGRERLLLATERALRAGRDIRVAEICKEAKVSAALIYKYFDDREDLIAEGYGRIYQGLVAQDLAGLADFPTEPAELRIAIRNQARQIFSRDRDDIRWARLEALSHARINPGVARRIEKIRTELVEEFANVLMAYKGAVFTRDEAATMSVIALGLVLGVTAMSYQELSDEKRDGLAEMWSTMMMATLAKYAE
ncbi:MAG: TetR/AcrR family transcriptional regulator [Actinomycetota bacterium]|nr:TetR/AcrR family transcriptional regulator [Actinomycetota bacterium]